MTFMFLLLYVPIFAAILTLYFRIADRFSITDRPNFRSSHNIVTIRGGGIIFPLSFLIHFIVSGFEYPFFIIGLLIISLISFIDDVKPLSNKVRIAGHVTATSLLFFQAELVNHSYWVLLVGYIIVIGTINAYNFMDGINGITGAYSMITILSLWYINDDLQFIENHWFVTSLIALLVFNYYNFRRIAKCFAGDVGSVSMAFILVFFIVLVVIETNDLKYIGFLLLYGLDTISTIIFRLLRKENIFEAHRSHFYQYLANTNKWPHLVVSTMYFIVQLTLNALIVSISLDGIQLILFFLIIGFCFIGIRYLVEGKTHLLGKTDGPAAL